MIFLMNTTIMPNNEGVYISRVIKPQGAIEILAANQWTSAIGHEAAAIAMSAILGMDVPMNRATIALQDGDVMLCLKLNSRPPEGVILTKTEMDEIGYELVRIMYSSSMGSLLKKATMH